MERTKTKGLSEKRESKVEGIELLGLDNSEKLPLPPVPGKITSNSPRGKSVTSSTL